MLHEVWILVGAAIPVIPLLLWWVAGGSLADADTAAVWTAAGMVVVYEVIAGLRAELNAKEMAVQLALGATLGVLIISLKLVLH
jgi:hypothetical protein